ncbi:nucleotide-binding universal stress UspA family protein [Amycolatopsis endophytica]|uniref:Nucleotide-binding universal stress UspA family protein n=1 Tax=Amycolatopsis endophytica TaxID=860233 RepID=A0A853B8X7_9PSEU|nr:universal stress protein [Amycolatopsis endophytica]NYI90886.1 nucleotide-binding universal stress UspA family protein [Amycolatopsis endophytica]
MGAERASGQLVEEYGPAWSPGRFERGTDGPHVVLAGVDGSPSALRAGAYAAGLARRQRSRLVLVYVLAPSAWTGIATGYLAAAQEQSYEAIIDEMRKPIRALADEAQMPVTFIVRRGDAYAELRRAAVELHADLVVVGTSESKGHRIVGSVANRLMKAGLWPVTVVP